MFFFILSLIFFIISVHVLSKRGSMRRGRDSSSSSSSSKDAHVGGSPSSGPRKMGASFQHLSTTDPKSDSVDRRRRDSRRGLMATTCLLRAGVSPLRTCSIVEPRAWRSLTRAHASCAAGRGSHRGGAQIRVVLVCTSPLASPSPFLLLGEELNRTRR
jgi:hypothetical protein